MTLETQTIEFRNLGLLDWDAAAREQERIADARARGECPDTVLFVEHEPVYTCGLRFRPENFRLSYDPSQPTYCGIPVRRAYRGGELTYHGPGQLVVYPILRLPHGGQHLRRLIDFYQTLIIEVLGELGIAAFTCPDAIGVWTDRGKIASIGVGLRRGVTRNGFAINVATDPRAFEPILACGRSEPMANINDFHLEYGGLTPPCFRAEVGSGMLEVGKSKAVSSHRTPKNKAASSRRSPERISIDEVRALVEKHFIVLSRAWLPTREDASP